MPIPIENSVVTPNSVYAPSIVLQVGIQGGKLVTSAHITLAAARCENAGEQNETWVATGQVRTITIPDIMNVEQDLVSLSSQVLTVYGGIVGLIAAINAIRKVL